MIRSTNTEGKRVGGIDTLDATWHIHQLSDIFQTSPLSNMSGKANSLSESYTSLITRLLCHINQIIAPLAKRPLSCLSPSGSIKWAYLFVFQFVIDLIARQEFIQKISEFRIWTVQIRWLSIKRHRHRWFAMASAAAPANKIERAHQLYRDGRYEEALGFYTEALSVAKIKQQKIALHSNRAACYLKLHDFKKVHFHVSFDTNLKIFYLFSTISITISFEI